LFQIRTFRTGDESRLVGLANRAYTAFGGHVVRDVEGWRWSILDRPGVDPEDVMVVEAEDNAIVGYGVLGPGGVVLELCLDPDLAGRERAAVAKQLVGALEERCQSRGFEAIAFELPISDSVVDHLLVGDGYRSEETHSLTVNVIDLPGLLQKILAHHRDSLPPDWRADFLLDIAPGTYPSHRGTRLRVQIDDGKDVLVSEASNGFSESAEAPGSTESPPEVPAPIEIATDLSAITEIVFGRSSFDAAKAAGRIRVEPGDSERRARTLFELMAIKSPWYTPPADGR
jgi:hypothetical protein